MILVDSNVPMYLVGAAHPHKIDAQRLLEHCVASGEKLVTDAEVLQEILHRYVAIGRPDAIQPAFDALRNVVDEVLPIAERDVTRAKDVVLGASHLSARDALHLAVMEHHRIGRILSFDRGFDECPGIARLGA
jgi:predicted nucleic acid-binding protein